MVGAFQETDLPFVARDGLPLSGILLAPERPNPPPLPAVVLVHGMAGSRFGPLSEWGRELARRGFTVLVISTRGSDWSWSHGGRLYGGSHERLDEAPHDLSGAVAALRDLGHRHFLLAGQSLGAVKVTYTQATEPIADVVGIVPKSGPRFSADALARHGEAFTAALRAAEERVAAGEPDAILDVKVPITGPMAAGSYLEKYGPHGRYDWVALLKRVAVPKLVILGGSDPSRLVSAAREAIQRWERRPPGCDVWIMPNWGHGFEAPGEKVPATCARLVTEWWARIS